MKARIFAFLLFCLSSVHGQANYNTTGNYVAERLASVTAPRGLLLDDAGDILVVSQGLARITAIYQENSTVNTAIIVESRALGLNHGIAYNKQFLYASSMTAVYRWAYIPGQRTGVTTAEQIVVRNIPTGGHWSRTLIFDKDDNLYISIGSGANVDRDSSRARIRRFNLTAGIPQGGIDFNTGVVFADGLRNEVGLAFDEDGILWGVQNGADNLNRADLGGDIHNTNPADEMTKFDKPLGTHYGYPYCWTVDQLQNYTKGDQFAWPDFMNDGIHTDAWCRNASNNHPPTLPLPAHYAALGITFYDAKVCNTSAGAFPCSMKGDAFVAYHGSWNREPAEGYKVVRIPIDPATRLPTGEELDIMYEPSPDECGRCFRPVNLVFDQRGHLIVSSDASSEIFRITYDSSRSRNMATNMKHSNFLFIFTALIMAASFLFPNFTSA